MPLTANFIADFSSFINACADATKSTAEVQEAGDKLAGSFNQSVQAVAGQMQTVGTGIAEFGHKAWEVLSGPELKEFGHAVTEFAMDFIGDFGRAEDATVRLRQALKDSGNASPEVAKKYSEMAESLQKISTFSKVAITDAQAVFTQIGQIGPDAMEKTLTAAMNLAAYMRTDVPDAAKLMEKAAASNGAAVGRLKIALGDAYEKGMSFDEIVNAISKRFDGQFAEALTTTNGQLEHLKNQVEGVNEQIGEQMAGSLKTMIGLFEQLPEPMQKFAIGAYQITDKIGPVASAFGNLAQVVGVLFPAAMIAAGDAIITFIGGLIGWPALIVAGLVAIGVVIYKNWDDIKMYFKAGVEAIKGWLTVDLPAAFDAAVQTVAKWYYGIKYWLQDQFGALVDWVVNKIPQITAAFKLAAEAIVFYSIVPEMIDGIGSQFSRLQAEMVDPALTGIKTVVGAFSGMRDVLGTQSAMFSPWPIMPTLTRNVDSLTPIGMLTPNSAGSQININMTGMLGTDDPQTRQMISNLVSDAVMQGMRGGRLLGTA